MVRGLSLKNTANPRPLGAYFLLLLLLHFASTQFLITFCYCYLFFPLQNYTDMDPSGNNNVPQKAYVSNEALLLAMKKEFIITANYANGQSVNSSISKSCHASKTEGTKPCNSIDSNN